MLTVEVTRAGGEPARMWSSSAFITPQKTPLLLALLKYYPYILFILVSTLMDGATGTVQRSSSRSRRSSNNLLESSSSSFLIKIRDGRKRECVSHWRALTVKKVNDKQRTGFKWGGGSVWRPIIYYHDDVIKRRRKKRS